MNPPGNKTPTPATAGPSGTNQRPRIQLTDSFYAETKRLWELYAAALTDDREPERTDPPPQETTRRWHQVLRLTYDRIARNGGEYMEIVEIISHGLEQMLGQFVDNQLLDLIYRVIRARENTHNIHEISLRLLTRIGQVASETPWMTAQSIATMDHVVAEIQALNDAARGVASGNKRAQEGPSSGSMIQEASPGPTGTSGETLKRVPAPADQPTNKSARPRSAKRPVVTEPAAARPMTTPATASTEMHAFHEANSVAERHRNPLWKHVCSHLCGCGQSSESDRVSSDGDTNA